MGANEYENERNKRIAANRERLASMGLTAAKEALDRACTPTSAPKAKSRVPKPDWAMIPSRTSARAASMPKPDYKQETLEGEVREYVKKQQRRGNRSQLYNVEDTSGPGFAYVKIMQPSLISGGYWAQAPFGLGQWLPNKESLEKAGVVFNEKECPKANIVLECGGEEWDVVWMNRSKTGDGGGFSGGWRGFAIDQRLASGDAVVFKKEEGLVLRCSIYRSWLHKSAREAHESAFEHADEVMATFEAQQDPPVAPSCCTDPSIHCHSRRAAGLKDAEAKRKDRQRAGADPDLCLELARAEHNSLHMSDGVKMMSIASGITHTKAAKVDRKLAVKAKQSWPEWKCEESEFETRHTYGFEEQMLFLSGCAMITPQNAADKEVTVRSGDLISFGRGLRCHWVVREPVEVRYVYMDEQGNELQEESLSCDRCQKDCWDRSWLVGDEDLCLACYEKGSMEGGVYQEQGQPTVVVNTSATVVSAKRDKEDPETEPSKPRKKPKVEASPKPKLKEVEPKAEAKKIKPKLEKVSTAKLVYNEATSAVFAIGSKVWAKLPGWPAWPAKVSTPEAEGLEHEEAPRAGLLFIAFYGEDSYQWLSSSKLKPLDDGQESLAKPNIKELHDALEMALQDS